MSQPTIYEQLIAQKLQELAVPDQADAIWATIGQQLNIEMPVNGPGSGGLNNPGWWIGGSGLFTLFVATVTYIFVSRQNLETERNVNDTPVSIEYQQPLENKKDTLSHTAFPMEIKKNKPAVVPGSDGGKKEEAVPSSIEETENSSPAQKIEEVPAAPLVPTDTVVTGKKARGVKGISDADYRLVPSRKDSVKRKKGSW
jgi:hypothetical protein